ncbi:MAG TPA: FAD-dependent oxidoreductase [Thermoanaerobaculia bacterium]|nr:FAD-dependent oxidoreductase [Thermoanaerobaculia bacterium]
MPSLPHVAVVGAGAFGGWTALRLRERGCRVTLFDAWGPGNSRASSGGETRVIRAVYGADRLYVQWAARSLKAWLEAERQWGVRLYHPAGILWMCGEDDGYVRAALPLLADEGLPISEIGPAETRRRFPQIDTAGLRSVWFEETAGYLMARRACRAVAEAFARAGGEFRQERVLPGERPVAADAWVFACGPWLPELFPEVRVRPSRQDVFFFGTPPGFGELPVWMELAERSFYGIPSHLGGDHRGFKIADDTRGEPFDPTWGDRTPDPEAVARAREYLKVRFPGLASAPLVESRVCQYENSPDGHFLVDRLPGTSAGTSADDVWIAGGGSGHGFKLGPAVGDHVADLVLGKAGPLPQFRLDRSVDVIRTQFS